MPKGLEGMTYEEQMWIFCLFSSEKRRVQSDLIAVYNSLMMGRGGGTDLFFLVSSDGMY